MSWNEIGADCRAIILDYVDQLDISEKKEKCFKEINSGIVHVHVTVFASDLTDFKFDYYMTNNDFERLFNVFTPDLCENCKPKYNMRHEYLVLDLCELEWVYLDTCDSYPMPSNVLKLGEHLEEEISELDDPMKMKLIMKKFGWKGKRFWTLLTIV